MTNNRRRGGRKKKKVENHSENWLIFGKSKSNHNTNLGAGNRLLKFWEGGGGVVPLSRLQDILISKVVSSPGTQVNEPKLCQALLETNQSL